MRSTSLVTAVVLPLVAGTAFTGPPWLPVSIESLRTRFDGERALATTAPVAGRWRWPGNRAFNESVRQVAGELRAAGFVDEKGADPDQRLVLHVESRPMRRPSWEPLGGSLHLDGDEQPLLAFATNRNMIAIGSTSIGEPITAEIVDVGAGRRGDFEGVDVTGAIVMGDTSAWRLHREAMRRGAIGVLAFSIPAYNRAEEHPDSISFSSIAPGAAGGWALLLSRRARDRIRARLEAGPVRATVEIATRIEPSEELTLVAEVRGARAPEERIVLTAHVQEPGANDNASGVGCLTEIARVLADLLRDGAWSPQRSITMIWGDEISAAARYLAEDEVRAGGVRYGISLDMVGEDTSKTGGTFLIERMPDPSAVWTRGDDEHTEWGGRPLSLDEMRPHWLNDVIRQRCLDEAGDSGWVVRTNPFEGGSDHVPFLRAGTPAVLLWHFTDVYYHTDGDTLEMVSAETLAHVGVSTLAAVALMADPGERVAAGILEEIHAAAIARLETEKRLSSRAIASGADADEQGRIVRAWAEWYHAAAESVADVEIGGASEATRRRINEVSEAIEAAVGE